MHFLEDLCNMFQEVEIEKTCNKDDIILHKTIHPEITPLPTIATLTCPPAGSGADTANVG